MGALKAGVCSLSVFETLRSWHPMEAEATFGKPSEPLLGLERDYTLFKCCYFGSNKMKRRASSFLLIFIHKHRQFHTLPKSEKASFSLAVCKEMGEETGPSELLSTSSVLCNVTHTDQDSPFYLEKLQRRLCLGFE